MVGFMDSFFQGAFCWACSFDGSVRIFLNGIRGCFGAISSLFFFFFRMKLDFLNISAPLTVVERRRTEERRRTSI